MLSRRLLPLLVVWCLLVVLPGVVITAVFDIDIDSDIGGWVVGGWIIGYLAQLGVFLAISRVAQRNNILGWFIASLAPFVSDWGSPASVWGPLIAAVISGGFACWLYWSCTRQADLRAHGIPAEATVLEVKDPLFNVVINSIYLRRTLRLNIIRADGAPPYEVRWAGTFMLGQIPSVGDRLSVRVDRTNPRRFEVLDGPGDSSLSASRRQPVDDDLTEQLERLAQLHRNGQLTDAEFGAAKARLLGG